MRLRDRIRSYLGVLGDLAVLNAALWLALAVRHFAIPDPAFVMFHLAPCNMLFGLWLIGAYAVGLYELRRFRELPWMIRNILFALVVNGAVGLAFFYFFYPFSFVGFTPKTHFVLLVVFGHLGMFLLRRSALWLFDWRTMRRTVAFIGAPGPVRELRAELNGHAQVGFRPVDWTNGPPDLAVVNGRWLDDHWGTAQSLIRRLVTSRIPVVSFSEFYESIMGKIPQEAAAEPNWLIHAVLSRNDYWYRYAKRSVDVILGLGIAIVCAPVLGACALAILVFDGRPVLFCQNRIGLLGSEFCMWKFRTLAVGSEASGPFTGASATSRQQTRSGRWLRRFRLDELPQLLNVLRGEMSLVGPRPEWTREVAVLERRIPLYHLRHLARPGMTGWAQLNFRATRSPSDSIEKFRYDLYYIKHLSLDLDLTILLRTARRLFARESALRASRARPFRMPGRFEQYAADLTALLARPARAS